MSGCEKEIINLRLELERGEALHQHLESEMSGTRKEAHTPMYCTEDELGDVKSKVLELQGNVQKKPEIIDRRVHQSQLIKTSRDCTRLYSYSLF